VLGKMLINNYNSVDAISSVINKGDASMIDDTITTCKFYNDRDGNDSDGKPRKFSSVADEIFHSTYEYVYVFETDMARWQCYDVALEKWSNLSTLLYPPGNPLSDEQVDSLIKEHLADGDLVDIAYLIRAVEEKHGILETSNV
jgi:hypothetical protein